MTTEVIVKQVKKVIMQELLMDVNDNECMLDLYIDGNNEIIRKLSKVTKTFLEQKIENLIEEHRSERRLFFRKYNYEEILNEYLESNYSIEKIEMDFFSSEKETSELEEYKQEIQEKQIKVQEENIINAIPYLQWKKEIRVSTIVYETVDENNRIIKLYYAPKKKGKNTYNKLIYDNKPLQLEEYDVNTMVEMIENTHPQNVKSNRIVTVTRPEYSKLSKTKKEQYEIFHEVKEKYMENLIKEYEVKQHEIENWMRYFQNKCKYQNKDANMSCELKDRPCTVFFTDCLYNSEFMNVLRTEKKKKMQYKLEPISDIAKKYNTTPQNVKCIAGIYKSRCIYCVGEKCNFEKVLSSVCSLQYCECVFHDDFFASMEKHSAKNLQKQKNSKSSVVTEKKEETKKIESVLQEIGLKDFVVRRNVFKCMHNKHKIDNVVAMINIDNDGKKQRIKISAGYCSQCKVYFILDSTYQTLKKKGMILCRITDEKNYMKGSYVNGMLLARESILMQYGYTVSRTEGLSATSRQKILAVIIDNRIMAKSEIISYLDFFISQHGSRNNMEIAVSKWEADREFVENYKLGEYTQFGVKAIYRR